ncbi:MAG: hypothetical protein LBL21_03050 [Rickettsiales bacterium]|nr:hypothetical protein [Rickettsiales bacterium]
MRYCDGDIKLDRKKYGLWIKDFPIFGAEYYADETGDKYLDFHILFLNPLAFDWTPKQRRGVAARYDAEWRGRA